MDDSTRIRDLELTVRSQNCLCAYGILTVGDLLKRSRLELKATQNLGRKSLIEIENLLRGAGLALKPDMPFKREPPKSLRWNDEMREALRRDRETMTLRQCGTKYGITPARVRQIMAGTARRMRCSGATWEESLVACSFRD